jgi:hypothetical protein
MFENNNNGFVTEKPGLFDSFTGFLGKFGNKLKGNTEESKPPTENTSYTGTGGARSRRRKCNKKHRHTKSCRKYVKKGRKTRKH